MFDSDEEVLDVVAREEQINQAQDAKIKLNAGIDLK